jgi:DNA-binding CsgD family transcriptional regulator
MRRSETVGIAEVQAMLRLVAETAELWYDPLVQRRYTLESLCKLLPAKAGICFTFGDVIMGGDVACGSLVQSGMDESQERLIKTYLQKGEPADPALPKLAEIAAPVVVARRSELVNDKLWYASPYYVELREPLGFDDTLYAKITVPGKIIALALLRPAGDEPFTERQSQLVDLCLSQMSWPFQPDDKAVDPRLASLQPRLRKVMQHLLDGDGEKQVAAKLGLSRHTVHEYVKMIYQQLGVSSRSELLSQWVGRV